MVVNGIIRTDNGLSAVKQAFSDGLKSSSLKKPAYRERAIDRLKSDEMAYCRSNRKWIHYRIECRRKGGYPV